MQVAIKETYYDVPRYAMSAEIENGKNDEPANNKLQMKFAFKKLSESWQIIFKFIELIFCCMCMGFAYEAFKGTELVNSYLHYVGLTYTTFMGYTLIICVMLLARIIQDRVPYKTSAIYSIVGTCLFIVTGILLLSSKSYLVRSNMYYQRYYQLNMLASAAYLSLASAAVFLADACLIIIRKKDF